MFAPVDPVPAQRPAYATLELSAINPAGGERWQSGMAWRPERCPQGSTFDPCDLTFESPPVGLGNDGLAYYRPVAFRIEDRCSTRTGAAARDLGRVRRQAEAATSYFMARELETGDRSQANPYDVPGLAETSNAYLASPDATVVTGTWDVVAGVGALEEEARQGALGLDVFLHMPPRLIASLDAILVSEGSLLRTRTGARVVADPGYTGRGPDVPGTSEVQTVTITGAPTGGTFTLTFSAQTTAAIPFDAAAGVVESALNALSNLDGVTVTGAAGGPYTVTFPASMGNVAQMTGDASGLTGGTAPAVVVATTTPGVNPSVAAGLWIYATSPVQVRLEEIILNSIIDHDLNEVINTADRLFAATFDPCSLHAIQLDDPAPAP